MAKEGAQGVREGQADAGLDVDLMDAAYLVFDRIFGREDVAARVVYLVQTSVEGGGLAAAGGTRDEDDAVGALHERVHQRVVSRREAELLEAL